MPINFTQLFQKQNLSGDKQLTIYEMNPNLDKDFCSDFEKLYEALRTIATMSQDKRSMEMLFLLSQTHLLGMNDEEVDKLERWYEDHVFTALQLLFLLFPGHKSPIGVTFSEELGEPTYWLKTDPNQEMFTLQQLLEEPAG